MLAGMFMSGVFVSDMADGAVLIPTAALVAVVLGVSGWWRGLAAWIGCIGVAFLVVAMLKTAALLIMNGDPGAISPSGHVAGAVALYAGLAMLMLRGRVHPAVLGLPPLLVAIVVGVARVEVRAHSPLEAAIGALLGAGAAWALVVLAGQRPRRVTRPVLAVTLLAGLACHGLHLNSEQAIAHTVATL